MTKVSAFWQHFGNRLNEEGNRDDSLTSSWMLEIHSNVKAQREGSVFLHFNTDGKPVLFNPEGEWVLTEITRTQWEGLTREERRFGLKLHAIGGIDVLVGLATRTSGGISFFCIQLRWQEREEVIAEEHPLEEPRKKRGPKKGWKEEKKKKEAEAATTLVDAP